MNEPTSPIKRFGVAMVGPKVEWGYLDDDGEPAVQQFRAAHTISFEQLLEYQSMTAYLQAEATLSKRRVDDALRALKTDDPDAMDRVREITASSNEDEQVRWVMVVEQCLMLVHPNDVEELRPRLEKGNPSDVRDLRDYLSSLVIDRIKPEVEHAAHVDPTSQPSGTDSPATDDSGPASDSEE